MLTGEVQILRCDLFMDFGDPLNPLVDLGQAEGGFVMALGYFFSEEVGGGFVMWLLLQRGARRTRSPLFANDVVPVICEERRTRTVFAR